MIYVPDTAVDKLSASRASWCKGMTLLRSTDHLVSAQRLRDEPEEERRKPSRRDSPRSGHAG